MERGIIGYTGHFSRIDSSTVSIANTMQKEDLNYYVLYWDKILIPTTNIFHLALPNEEELITMGILKRPVVEFSSFYSYPENSSYNLFLESQLKVAKELLSKKSSTDWTIHQIGDELIIMDGFNKDLNTIKVSLIECLPVPYEDVSFEKILDFKLKRNDELIALHSSIDALYLEILKSPDQNLSSKKSISEFQKSIRDIEKSSQESFKRLKKYDLTTEINLNGKDIALAIGGGAAFDFYTNGMTIPIVTIIAGLASVVNIKASKSRSFEPAEDNIKLSYLTKAKKAKIIL